MMNKNSGKLLGPVGLWYPLGWPEPEIKWGLIRAEWGKGYAREAAETVRAMAASYLPDIQLISLLDLNNKGSVKVAESVGAVYEKTIPFRDGEAAIYRHKSA